MSTRRSCRPTFRSGLSLFEVLVALVITATLLTATAVALDASIKAYQINIQQASLIQMERVTMNRILSTIRRSKLHAPEDPTLSGQFASGQTVTGGAIVMYDTGGAETSFRYDATNQVLNLVTNGSTHAMVVGVLDFEITMEPMRSAESVRTGGSWDLLKRATILLTVKTTNQTAFGPETPGSLKMTLSASIMPRRNTW